MSAIDIYVVVIFGVVILTSLSLIAVVALDWWVHR